MKNYKEIANDVIKRINKYKSDQKRKQKKLAGIAISLCCVCVAALTGFGLWQGGWINARPGGTPDKGTTSGTEDPTKVFRVIALSQDSSGEFAADMYRPAGFHNNIGSALALKMSIEEDMHHKFSVLVGIPEQSSLEKLLDSMNGKIHIADALPVSISGNTIATDKYYFLLTAEQIIALAESGAKCYYVGSGEGDYQAMNWDTAEGINAYCELHGDMYIVDANNVRYCPDTGITENPLP